MKKRKRNRKGEKMNRRKSLCRVENLTRKPRPSSEQSFMAEL